MSPISRNNKSILAFNEIAPGKADEGCYYWFLFRDSMSCFSAVPSVSVIWNKFYLFDLKIAHFHTIWSWSWKHCLEVFIDMQSILERHPPKYRLDPCTFLKLTKFLLKLSKMHMSIKVSSVDKKSFSRLKVVLSLAQTGISRALRI